MQDIMVTDTTRRILKMFMADTSREISGADVWRETKIWSGTRYPILIRLERSGWLKSRWEEVDPHEAGRPRKRLYLLTEEGERCAQYALREEVLS